MGENVSPQAAFGEALPLTHVAGESPVVGMIALMNFKIRLAAEPLQTHLALLNKRNE